jgi:hypothetical protein
MRQPIQSRHHQHVASLEPLEHLAKLHTVGLGARDLLGEQAWEEDTVEKIIRRYVGRQAVTKALIAQINEAKKRT